MKTFCHRKRTSNGRMGELSQNRKYRWGSLRFPGKTVYLLGAGFTARAGMPVLVDFIPIGMDLLIHAASQQPSDETNAILGTRKEQIAFIKEMEMLFQQFRGALNRLGKPLENLEDLFCLVDLAVHEGSEGALKAQITLGEFIRKVLHLKWRRHENALRVSLKNDGVLKIPTVPRALFERVDIGKTPIKPTALGHRVDHNVCAYEAFLSKLLKQNERKSHREEDVIVTLNYDLVIERTLDRLARNSGVNPRSLYYRYMGNHVSRSTSGSRIPILKLHGSIDWELVVADPPRAVEYSIERVPGRKRRDYSRPLAIVPPTWRKTSSGTGVYTMIYQQAMWHFQHADRLVVIGYSFPETDAYFRYLLATAMNTPQLPRIEVIGIEPKEQAVPRLNGILGNLSRGRLVYIDHGFPKYMLSEIE